jgi:hypothetical protein
MFILLKFASLYTVLLVLLQQNFMYEYHVYPWEPISFTNMTPCCDKKYSDARVTWNRLMLPDIAVANAVFK